MATWTMTHLAASDMLDGPTTLRRSGCEECLGLFVPETNRCALASFFWRPFCVIRVSGTGICPQREGTQYSCLSFLAAGLISCDRGRGEKGKMIDCLKNMLLNK